MSNFDINIQMSADAIAHMIQHICVPQNHALMGIAPILTILFGTDDTAILLRDLQVLDSGSRLMLSDKVKDVVASDNYPLSDTVWQFNDPLADIKVLTTALGVTEDVSESPYAMEDLAMSMEMVHDTFPFIEIGHDPILESDILEFTEDHSREDSTPPRQQQAGSGSETWIVPSLAVGSLMLLGSRITR